MQTLKNLAPVADVVEQLTGKRPTHQRVYNMVRKGTGGIRLQALWLDGSWRCDRETYLRFLDECTAARLQSKRPAVSA